MLTEKMLYTLADISIIPNQLSAINSRSECSPYCNNIEQTEIGLPLIVAPMSSIIGDSNYKVFKENKISCIIPRNIPIQTRLMLCKDVFCAFSLSEIEEYFINKKDEFKNYNKLYILIDIANGHMIKQLTLGNNLKEIYKDKILLMGGNIANPKTYYDYNKNGFDYVRIGIAGGSQCLTGTHTGVYYPMASLINDTYELKKNIHGKTKIIADGGIGCYSDAIKCLALGADYVMMGKVFAKSEEAIGEIIESQGKRYRKYYGMSTKIAQAEILGKSLEEARKTKNLKTAEGKVSMVEIEYTLNGWVENFVSYLTSAMSYSSCKTLDNFRELARCQVISTTSSKGINEK